MDGVLIEAKDWHYEALNKALRLFGTEISRYDHLTSFDGLPTRVKLDMLSEERGLPRALHSFINEMKQVYTTDLVHQFCKPRFVHQFALSRLKMGLYTTAVCSNSVRSTVEIMMQKSDLAKFLDMQFSADDVQNPKPAPDLYLAAMHHFGANPEECLIIEDNENGIKAARASGAHVLVVKEVDEVNYHNIMVEIVKIENGV
jgi:beta-phosphoglucomutase-like phosphatase (HAD superfamily)